ncbi:glycoside hydrolase [Solirubrobacter phytolaccae]|uniref:Glycoside hydrolase n=1 Tax=Solirubrobacter phytolaccae TaxID=1404360 RepID=A0A9X3NHV1_9ACTN|nr:sialidase family protein [Solirubrobacter phytolaccae]MDA0185377.1 glycoside hydrolase [Solirubrobacter phytolaccae]
MWPRLLPALTALLASATIACGDEDPVAAPAPPAASTDPGPVHVHGLGVNPSDGAVLIATHTGLFRAGADEDRARRVGESAQDTMGFAIVGPDHFLGSGHPDPADTDLPPYLGLIESRDAGRTWRPLSLHGDVDFHLLESGDERVYGYGSDFATREPRFLTSKDGGKTWTRLTAPEPLISLALAPGDGRELIASGQRGLHRSSDGGRTWASIDAPAPGHLAWTDERVVLADLDGQVWHGADADRGRWRPAGHVGGEPAAFDHGAPGELLAALHDGTVKQSRDAGRTWTVRSQP